MDEPLLGNTETSTSEEAILERKERRQKKSTRIAVGCATIYFLWAFAEYVVVAPRIRLLELSVCRTHYQSQDPSKIGRDGSVQEKLCKLSNIQSSVASYRSWQVGLNAIPSLILCVPFGRISDERGRKPFLFLAFAGYILSQIWTHAVFYFYNTFPIWAMLLTPICLVVGAGPPILDSMVTAVVIDISTEEHLAPRLNWILAAFLAAEIIAPSVSSYVSNFSLWAPFLICLASSLFALIVIAFMPETMQQDRESATPHNDPEPSQNCEPFRSYLWRISIALGVFLLGNLRNMDVEIMVQYASKKFEIPIGQAAVILSLAGASTICFYLGLVPLITNFTRKTFGTSITQLNYRFSLFYTAAQTLGALMMGFAPTLTTLALSVVLLSVGTGVRQSWVSVLVAHINESHIATLSTVVATLETVGSMCGAPILGVAASKGFEFGGLLMGLPFFTSSASPSS